jgi:hypothetical protein
LRKRRKKGKSVDRNKYGNAKRETREGATPGKWGMGVYDGEVNQSITSA